MERNISPDRLLQRRGMLLVFWHRFPSELVFWISALIILGLSDPLKEHLSLCPFKWLGISFCPGCGLGHSISWLFRGQWDASISTHPLGPVAVLIIFKRIVQLLRFYLFPK